MKILTPTRLLLAALLLLVIPCAVAQRPGGGGPGGHGAGGNGPGGGAGNGPGNPGMGGPQGQGNGLMTGGHGGPMAGSRVGGSANAPMTHATSPFGLGSRWWDDRKTIKQLGLRPDQQQRMDQIFEVNRGTLVSLYTNLQTEESKLRGLSSADREDETKVFAAVDRVTQARAQLQKQSLQIVQQLHGQLDPPQLSLMEQASR